jgi:benzodiazapine receptor
MTKPSLSQQLVGLAGWLLASFSAGAIGAVASVEARTFYGQLIRPDWAPPGWIFAPVWTTLYALMGIAAWLIWRRNGFKASQKPLTLFSVQLAVNALWSWLFFAWRQGGLAFAEVVVLWVLVLFTCLSFWRSHVPAGVLMLPYLAWVTFASLLTYATWQLNPGLL